MDLSAADEWKGKRNGHLCCIMHFLLMMLALLVYVFYTKSMKRQQARVAKLRDEFETELHRRRLGLDR